MSERDGETSERDSNCPVGMRFKNKPSPKRDSKTGEKIGGRGGSKTCFGLDPI